MNVMSSSRALGKKRVYRPSLPIRRYLNTYNQVRLYKHYLVLLKLKKEQTNKQTKHPELPYLLPRTD